MGTNVCVTEQGFLTPELEQEMTDRAGIEALSTDARTAEELAAATDEETVAIVTAEVPVTETILERLTALRVVAVYGPDIGVVDIDAATERGVVVTRATVEASEEAATHAFALLLACERHVSQYDAQVRAGGWDWQAYAPIHRLSKKTLGIVGFGGSGRRMVKKASGLGTDILAFDPTVTAEVMYEYGVEKVDFDSLLDDVDIVVVTKNPTARDEYLFDGAAFKRMGETAILVDTSHDTVVDQAALYDALRTDAVAGAGLDISVAVSPPDERLVALDDVVVTPGIAWWSRESADALRHATLEDVLCVLAGEPPGSVLNPEALG